jgi:hypothetical protein
MVDGSDHESSSDFSDNSSVILEVEDFSFEDDSANDSATDESDNPESADGILPYRFEPAASGESDVPSDSDEEGAHAAHAADDSFNSEDVSW